MAADHPFTKANWIWPGDSPYANNTYAQYRRDFELSRVPPKAPMYITADQNYMVYINGQYVGRGPARGYQYSWPHDEYDIAPLLQIGHNWISVRQYSGGISTFGYLFQWSSGMLCAMRWKGFELVSDSEWRSMVSPAYRKYTKRVSVQLNLQEQVDARLDDQQWIRSARQPGGWKVKTQAFIFGVMPWHCVEPREIPNLGNEILAYEKACYAANGKCAPGYDDVEDMIEPLRTEAKGLKWKAASDGKAGAGGYAYEIPASGKGRFSAVTLDLGRLGVGNLVIDARGAAGGETLDVHYCEVLNKDGSPFIPGSISMGSRVILRKGRTQHEFYQMMGHRYVTLVLRDATKPVKVNIALRETVYPFDIKGSFTSDDTTLNDIHDICVRTQRVCSLDSYVDTPWREQAQWWGDARVQAANTFHLCDDARLLKRGIRSLARQEVPNGLTYGHAPTNSHACILPDFSITWVLTIWDYYWQTGCMKLFVEQWERIERVLGYFRGEGRDDNGLLKYDRRYWLFLDWSTIPKEKSPTLLNMWYLYMLERLGTLCQVAGMTEQAKQLGKEYRRQKKLIDTLLWDETQGLYCDGLNAKGRQLKSWSIHSQTAAMMCGLKKKHHSEMVEQCLLPYLQDEQTEQPIPSSFWVHYVYGIMTDLGYGSQVVDHIRKHYAPMIAYGGTWEIFKWAPGRGTVSHAWSAHPIKHLAATLGGIRQLETGWKRVRFSPVLDVKGVDATNVVVPTPVGLIKVKWKSSGDKVNVQLALPKSVSAEINLTGVKEVLEGGKGCWEIPISN